MVQACSSMRRRSSESAAKEANAESGETASEAASVPQPIAFPGAVYTLTMTLNATEGRGRRGCAGCEEQLSQVENPQRSPTQKNISYFYKAAVLITSRAAAAKHSVRSAHTPFAAASPPCGGGRVVAACTGS